MGPHVLCSRQNISQGTISQFKRIGPCAWSCAVTGLLYGKPEGQWFSKRPAKVDTTHARRYLIVHHRSQSSSLLQEAKSLIWTATGEQQAKHITIGGSPSTTKPAAPLAGFVVHELNSISAYNCTLILCFVLLSRPPLHQHIACCACTRSLYSHKRPEQTYPRKASPPILWYIYGDTALSEAPSHMQPMAPHRMVASSPAAVQV